MNSLLIPKTDKTPAIDFNEGILKISGRSITEDPTRFYKPVKEWINEYGKNPPAHTQVHFKIEYSDTGSSKSLLDILKLLDSIHTHDNSFSVSWFFEEGDDDMYDQGVYFKTFVSLPFEFVELDEI